ncbi:PRC-barrel domain-containing protein [Indioceanicola profundi]|uniref:PRC-barrel domain-containing protein n=1 Tax=Indioceanicola profundi TaxID=2220096 RepID=UPI000E6ABBC2|nr:PRC-barrel domain-containing protein [Indioceanicola profundi]
MRNSLWLGTAVALVLGTNAAYAQQPAQQPAAGGADPAQVTVQQPAPDVTVQQPAPDVTVTQPDPEVSVSQPKPEVDIQTAKPEVDVQQTGKPEVTVIQEGEAGADPQRDAQGQQELMGEGEMATEREASTPPQQSDSTPDGAAPDANAIEGTAEESAAAVGAAGMPPESEVGSRDQGGSTDRNAITSDPAETAAATATEKDGSVGVAQAENLIGQSVTGPNGSEIGDIGDLLIDRTSGDIQGMIVQVGGFLGIGQREVMIPWEEANYDPGQGTVAVNLTKEQIEAMPEFNREQLGENMVGMRDQ